MSECFIKKVDRKVDNRPTLDRFLDELGDGLWHIKADRKNKRTLDQNKYYWGICVPMVKEGLRAAGFEQIRTNEHAHLVMGGLFLKRQLVNNQTGEVVSEWVESTTKLSTVQFSEYLESIWQWASDYLGIVIPAPNSQPEIFKAA